jgi:hypothetical protein
MSARSHNGALIAGLILIGVGIIFLFENWYLGFSLWRILARYWPLVLIFVGLRKLYGYLTWQEAAPAAPPLPPPPAEHAPKEQ